MNKRIFSGIHPIGEDLPNLQVLQELLWALPVHRLVPLQFCSALVSVLNATKDARVASSTTGEK